MLKEMDFSVNEKGIFKLLGIDDLRIYFQPIFSVSHRDALGFEALSRGMKNGKPVSPLELFEKAQNLGISYELDLLCRKRAFESFKPIYERFPDYLLFINYDASLIDQGKRAYILTLSQTYGIPPENIVIEVIEKRVKNEGLFLKFIENYKNLGFIVALDDVGEGFSNLKRIAQISPYLIKIDKEICLNIKEEIYFNILKALSSLSRHINSFVVMEGIEDSETIMKGLDLGINFFQGFHLSRPLPAEELYEGLNNYLKEHWKETLNLYTMKFIRRVINGSREKLIRISEWKKVRDKIILELKKKGFWDYPQIFKKWVKECEDLDAIYITDDKGIIVTETYFKEKRFQKLFKPASPGEPLTNKDYIYYIINLGFNSFITDPYVSQATGYKTVTLSKRFKIGRSFYILCLDMRV